MKSNVLKLWEEELNEIHNVKKEAKRLGNNEIYASAITKEDLIKKFISSIKGYECAYHNMLQDIAELRILLNNKHAKYPTFTQYIQRCNCEKCTGIIQQNYEEE